MKIELHMIQNFAPSCLNRDDTNAPKDCTFGGFRRARISSQCIKRSVRKYFMDHAAELGIEGRIASRTRLLHKMLLEQLVKDGKPKDEADRLIRFAMEKKGLKIDEDGKTAVLLFLEDTSVSRLKEALLSCWKDLVKVCSEAAKGSETRDKKNAPDPNKEKTEKIPPSVDKAFGALQRTVTEAVDIALFGRMVAELKHMNVDAACQMAHAISTHEVDMEMDFYTAVDDLQPEEQTGAGMMGIVEFNSSCFYRYSLLDLEQLRTNLGGDEVLARTAALAFVQASIYAIPTGKQNSMAAQNLPLYIRAILRKGGDPRSLANAFLLPVRPDRRGEKDIGWISVEKLEKHKEELDAMYGKGEIDLDFRSSVYPGHADGPVKELIQKLQEGLK